jgi:hypothetical protein
MTAKHNASRGNFPSAVNSGDVPSNSQMQAAAGGYVALGELYRPMTGTWPAVDATNGPLTADAGITNVAPSLTGLTQYKWNSGRFNTQSQNWQAVPTSNGVTANQCCQNVTTPRGSNYASTGLGFPCHSDFSFVADTTKIIIAYYQTTTGMANLGISSSAHEVQVFAEHEGAMKGIRNVPAQWPSGSGGNQMFYRVITFKEARKREFRVMLSVGCWLDSVYIDTGGQLSKAPNRPVLFGCFGDSWGEGAGNVFSSIGGNGASYGTTWPSGCSLLYSNSAIQYAIATGFACIIGHQGGTGYVNSNGAGQNEDSSVAGFTPFISTGQVDYFWTTFGTRYPCAVVAGGYNDGTAPVSAPITTNYQALVTKGYNKLLAKDPAMPILVQGIQCKTVTVGDGRDQANTGIKQAVAALQAAGKPMLGFIDDFADYGNNGSVYTDIWSADIGPDGLHPTVKGGDNIGQRRAKRSAQFLIARNRVAQMIAA